MTHIYNHEALEALVMKLGFLPFFSNDIQGFSVEEYTPRKLWFSGENDGPWEWKGPVAGNGNCAYGKLFNGKAGFVNMDWFPELINYRRSIYNIHEEIANESAHTQERFIYNTVVEHDSLLSKEIKALCGYKKPRRKRLNPVESLESEMVKELNIKEKRANNGNGFETILTRLQMGTWLVVADFEYQYNKQQQPYGWGIARYTTPEALFGKEIITASKQHSPEESKKRLIEHLTELLPDATPSQILKLIG